MNQSSWNETAKPTRTNRFKGTQQGSRNKMERFMTLCPLFFRQNMEDTFSEEALNTGQPTWRNKIGKKSMFSLMVSEGIGNSV